MLAALYARLEALKKKLIEYQEFQTAVNGAIPTLQPAIDSLKEASSNLDKFFINDARADLNSLGDSRDSVTKVSNDMNNVILPSIARKIAEIEAEIASGSSAIAAELARIAAEEAAAKSSKGGGR